ncbi:MAG: hypothetical protein V1763_00220 [Parcubacteria group bacterium]
MLVTAFLFIFAPQAQASEVQASDATPAITVLPVADQAIICEISAVMPGQGTPTIFISCGAKQGVPSFIIIDPVMYWGQQRRPMIEQWIQKKPALIIEFMYLGTKPSQMLEECWKKARGYKEIGAERGNMNAILPSAGNIGDHPKVSGVSTMPVNVAGSWTSLRAEAMFIH